MAFSLEELKKKNNNTLNGLKKVNQSGNVGLQTTKTSSSLSALKSNLGMDIKRKEENLNTRLNQMSAGILREVSDYLKENTTELIFIFDRSTSCKGTETSTIKGYNELIEKEKRSSFKTIVSTILFGSTDEIISNRVDINKLSPLWYRANGNTTLYDTLTRQLTRLKAEQLKDTNRSNKTLVIIMTDGCDYGSIEHDENDVRKIVTECKSLGWEFILLAANQNAKDTALSLGIPTQTAETFMANNTGYYLNFKAVTKALDSLREEGRINPNWSDVIKENNLRLENGNDGPTLRLGGKK